MSSLFDKDIKGVPVMSVLNPVIGIRYACTLSNSDTETGLKTARKNIMGHQ